MRSQVAANCSGTMRPSGVGRPMSFDPRIAQARPSSTLMCARRPADHRVPGTRQDYRGDELAPVPLATRIGCRAELLTQQILSLACRGSSPYAPIALVTACNAAMTSGCTPL